MSQISDRKKEHLDTALTELSQSDVSAGWDEVHLIAASLPEINIEEVDLTIELVGHRLQAPLIIASMTGGHDDAVAINERLAAAAQTLGVAIGSGSQRAALRSPSLRRSYAVIRETAPDAVVMANIGICQLVGQGDQPALSRDEIETAVGMIEAQFLIVHLNVLEEMIQPEGDRNLVGLTDALKWVASWSPVPLVVKETGGGLSSETATTLAAMGVAILDVGGVGGTSFARIEGERARSRGDLIGARLGVTFGDWGIPTAISVLETRSAGVPLIATGGVRSGLDAAKALALGAIAVGVGRPVLSAAMEGADQVIAELRAMVSELKMAMLLTGSKSVPEMQSHAPVLTGRVADWARQRGLL